MRIISIRKGFQADHSSTSYEFFAIDKPLDRADRTAVAGLSSRAMPTRRRVSFIYHGDWADLPGGWAPLMEKYYDVMYSESYDWWTLAMAFNTTAERLQEITKYDFNGTDDMGVSVEIVDKRVIVSIHCRMEPGFDYHDDYYESYEEDEEENEEYEETETAESGDYLLDLLSENREYLNNGDYRLLFGVWQEYGFEPEDDEDFEEETPPEPAGLDSLPQPVKDLLALLE
jgi:hypothetical protein